jgi:hypothetical protein
MFTRLGLVASVFGLLAVLSVSGIVPTDRPVEALIPATSFLTVGFLSVFKTEDVISPLFKSSRFFIIALKVLGPWFIVIGFLYLIGFAMGALLPLFS